MNAVQMAPAPADASMYSHSQSSASKGGTQLGVIDKMRSGSLFPIFDQMCLAVRLPNILYYIMLICIVAQVGSTILWMPGNMPLMTNPDAMDLLKWVNYIGYFTPTSMTNDQQNTVCIVLAVLFVVQLLYMIFVNVDFQKNRRFVKVLLYPARLCVEFIPTLLLGLSGSFAARSFRQMLNVQDATTVSSFVVGIAAFLGFILEFYFIMKMLLDSPYLTMSPLAAYDSSPFVQQVMVTALCTLGGTLLNKFAEWLVALAVVIHMLFCLWQVWIMTYRPFVRTWVNALFMGLVIWGVLMDIERIVVMVAKDMNGSVIVVTFFVFLVLSLVSAGVFYFLQNKRLKKGLIIELEEGEEEITEEMKIDHLIGIGLDKSDRKALMYLDYAVTSASPEFVDFFFIKFILSQHHSNSVMNHCLRVMAWFPSLIRPFNVLFANAVARREIGILDKFLLYQLQKIRMTRQASASNIAAEKLKSVKQASKDIDMTMKHFWMMHDCNITLLHQHAAQLRKTHSLWNEATIDYPNSVQFCEEYCTFLAETATDFTGAIKQKHKVDLIETGVDFNNDVCFKMFVKNFPHYIKGKMMDIKGNFIKTKRGKGTGSSNSQGMGMGSLSGTSSMDMAMEESLGKMIISNARVRLALERAVANRKPNTFGSFIFIACFIVLLNVAACTFMYIYFNSYFDNRAKTTERVELSNMVRLHLFGAALAGLYHWGNVTKSIATDQITAPYKEIDAHITPFFDLTKEWPDRMTYSNVEGRRIFMEFVEDISSMAEDGYEVFDLVSALFSPSTQLVFCDAQGKRLEPYMTDMRTASIYTFLSESLLMSIEDVSKWFMGQMTPCSLYRTLMTLATPYESVRAALSGQAAQEAIDAEKFLWTLKWALTMGVFGLSALLLLIGACLYCREINKFAEMLIKLPKAVKKECLKPMRKDLKDDEDDVDTNTAQPIHASKSCFSIPTLFHCSLVLVLLVIAILIFSQSLSFATTNTNYNYLNAWAAAGRSRKNVVLELCLWVSLGIVSLDYTVVSQETISVMEAMGMGEVALAKIEALTKEVMQDTDNSPSSIGYNDQIDSLTIEPECESRSDNPDFHEMYRCASVQSMIQFFTNAVQEVSVEFLTYGGKITTEVPAQLIHLACTHLLPKLMTIDDLFGQMSKNFNDEFAATHKVFFAVQMICCVVLIIVFVVYFLSMNSTYNVILTLLRRVSPAHIVGDKDLQCYLLNKTTGKHVGDMSTDQGIIFHSEDCIICLGKGGIIETVNPSVTNTFGFTPEQLLGQSASTLISEAHTASIEQQIQLMEDKQSAPTYEGHTICITDDDTEIPCSINILAIASASGNIDSFVMILRDESTLLAQQTEAEEAKKQSETLLYQILPRDIVIRLNAGEKDISFTVPSATISFLDIQKFSEYAATLTPQEIMGNLSLVFAGFDEAIAKYPLLIKIKLIGDVYMCAGGLFNPDDPPASHAEQMVRFGLDALQALEDTNIKLNAVLSVRIGVNTGGPLIAGVLGSDKPVFDIIGDPINIAARLQSTDIAGRIQISQSTYDQISGISDFHIEERGEVFLKGKGKSIAYFVKHPREAINFQASTSDLSLGNFA